MESRILQNERERERENDLCKETVCPFCLTYILINCVMNFSVHSYIREREG